MGGKTKKSHPRVKFPSSFSVSVNPKHYSTEEVAIKVLNEVIILYVTKERERLGLKKNQDALLISNVFKR